MSTKKRIMVLSGKRGGYGAMKPMLHAINESNLLELSLVLTDQHLSRKFGMTINEVEKDFTVNHKIPIHQKGSDDHGRAKALSTLTTKLSDLFHKDRPDLLVLYGDRGEVLSAAMVATIFGIPIAHIQGGDRTGSVDEQVRHAVTKLSHLHFVSTKDSAKRVLKMGEQKWRIHTVGDLHVDEICVGGYLPPKDIYKFLKIDIEKPIIVVLQHSETTEPEASFMQMEQTLKALANIDAQKIVIYPCSDVGYEGVIRAIELYALPKNGFLVYKNLDAPVFWGLLNVANVFVGNSSSGIIESGYFGLPTINIGRRQSNRVSPKNVIHTSHNSEMIQELLEKLISDKIYYKRFNKKQKVYGDGMGGKKIVSLLEDIQINKDLIVKIMSY
jgi:UDP-N-acetylglucosamine 2-epimerase (non-hydrolysing)/GDP/UDP-N,N'-diacetylbacillosamine 2-epimerase (hydrolysing)